MSKNNNYASIFLACVLGVSGSVNTVAAEKSLKIGVSVSDLGNPFFARIAQGAEAKARELVGDKAEVILVSSAYDVERQRRQIDQFVAQRVDMILLSAAVYDAFEEAIARAQQAGVKVLAVDVKAAGADATVTTDNPQAGNIACRYLAEQIQGTGNVVILNGPQVSSIIERVEGCQRVLAEYPDIHVLSSNRNSGGSREGGLEMMTHLLMAYPHIDAVFTINDPAALGAEIAAQQSGRDEFIIVSVDGAPSVVEAMKQPNALIRGTATQSPTQMAKKAVEMGFELMQGKTLDTTEVLIPAVLLTPETTTSAKQW